MTGICELCQRGEIFVTRHHLIPRTRHSNKRNQKLFERNDVRNRLAMLCQACHKQIHRVLTEKQMEAEYNTVERLAAVPEIQRFVEWIKNKPPGLHVK